MSDRWSEMQEVFKEALARPPEERDAFIRSSCEGDESLARSIDDLLKAHDEGSTFMDGPGTEEEPAGLVVAGYEIERELGRGGMGIVYLAHGGQPRRRVALKVLRAPTSVLRRRFERESQVLARLQHPGIAQVLDAGMAASVDGPVPYFAMEFVEGLPLHEAVRDVDLHARLALLADIADAVQHAHQKGVIHRDLKPGNIMVTSEGQVKVLDFGVARATDSDVNAVTMRTEVGQLLGTLSYMSPEQIAGDPEALDTRSDVYSLGVIGFELVSERLPHERGNQLIHEAVRIVADEPPTRLGTINRSWRGDLETIVLTAMARDRDRRYPSAASLASDLRRFLEDKPIEARPPSRLYVMGKFAKRHRWLVGATLIAVAVLVAGAGVSSWLALGLAQANTTLKGLIVDVESAREAEARRATAARRINEFFTDHLLLAAAPEESLGQEITIREALDDAALRVDTALADEPEAAAYVHAALASVYRRLDINDRVLTHSGRSLTLYQTALGDEHPRALHAQSVHAQNLQDAAQFEEAEALRASALAGLRATVGDDHDYTVTAMSGAAGMHMMRGRYEEAADLFEQVVEAGRRGVIEPIDHVNALVQLSSARRSLGREDMAEPLEEARAIVDKTFDVDHPMALSVLNALGAVYVGQDEPQKALPIIRAVVERAERILGEDHLNVLIARNNLARTLTDVGDFDEAEPIWQDVLARESFPPGHPLGGVIRLSYALALMDDDRLDEAEPLFIEAFDILAGSLGSEHAETQRCVRSLVEISERRGEDAGKWHERLRP